MYQTCRDLSRGRVNILTQLFRKSRRVLITVTCHEDTFSYSTTRRVTSLKYQRKLRDAQF